MVVNPPYVPTPEDEVGRDGTASAWAGGKNGRTFRDQPRKRASMLSSSGGILILKWESQRIDQWPQYKETHLQE
ncbi:hypothetical protein MKX01_010931 [Papaver californicum]|nr:hypothetical protein MKX01_010931 [Papaver californicum]